MKKIIRYKTAANRQASSRMNITPAAVETRHFLHLLKTYERLWTIYARLWQLAYFICMTMAFFKIPNNVFERTRIFNTLKRVTDCTLLYYVQTSEGNSSDVYGKTVTAHRWKLFKIILSSSWHSFNLRVKRLNKKVPTKRLLWFVVLFFGRTLCLRRCFRGTWGC